MRLLVAEDNAHLLKSLVFLLKREGHTVDGVTNGLDALRYIEASDYDGLVLDIMMPEVNGLEVLRRIRAKGINCPALLLTALSEVSSRVEGLDAGADDYLSKPFAVEELLARVRAMLRRRESFTPPVITFADVVLSTATHELEYEGRTVALSGKEFQVMELLMCSPGSIFTIESLLSQVWSWDSDVDSSAVWIQVSNLRKRIKAIEAPLSIRFKRGSGYILEEVQDV